MESHIITKRPRPQVPEGAPHFIIVGACKAGTTTLYDDLAKHPDTFLPFDKEPDILHKATDTVDALRLWSKHFEKSTSGQIRGEASTYYTMVPNFEDVSKLAQETLGSDVRIIYLMRHPINRIISQLGHDYLARRIDKNFDEAALNDPKYVAWSDYALQIKPWIENFGRTNVMTIVFEDFIERRIEITKSVCEFIGLNPYTLPKRNEISNTREGKQMNPNKILQTILIRTSYYKTWRHFLPSGIKNFVRKAPIKKPSTTIVTLRPETQAELKRRLAHVPKDLFSLDIDSGKWE